MRTRIYGVSFHRGDRTGVRAVTAAMTRVAVGAAVAALGITVLGGLVPTTVRADFACPVTIPNRSPPPPGGGGLGPGSLAIHGNGLLWTILPDDGVWRVPESGVRADGTILQKFVWWRRVVDQTTTTDADGVLTVESTYAGTLRITGHRLDADSPPVTATTRHEGVHVGSAITFPTGGCWEITGTTGEDVLTFTVYMLPPGEPMPNTAIRASPPVTALGVILLLAGSALAVAQRAPARATTLTHRLHTH